MAAVLQQELAVLPRREALPVSSTGLEDHQPQLKAEGFPPSAFFIADRIAIGVLHKGVDVGSAFAAAIRKVRCSTKDQLKTVSEINAP